ncbi:MAG: PEP-CTERM sorting domain-containing protein [Planctomycetota bacterium]
MRTALAAISLSTIVPFAAGQVTVVIDDFSDGEIVVSRDVLGMTSDSTPASVVGGMRDIELNVIFNPFSIDSMAEVDRADNNLLAFSSGAGNATTLTLTYAGESGDIDLSLMNTSVFALDFGFVDLDFVLTLVATDDDGNTGSTTVAVSEFAGFQRVEVLASALAGGSSLDLSNIASLSFEFNSDVGNNDDIASLIDALDFVLDEISVETPPIPTPGSMMIAGTGLMLVARRRRA